MAEMTVPDEVCSVDDCTEPAALAPRAAAADELVDAPAAEVVPLCAFHAEQAQAGGTSFDPSA